MRASDRRQRVQEYLCNQCGCYHVNFVHPEFQPHWLYREAITYRFRDATIGERFAMELNKEKRTPEKTP